MKTTLIAVVAALALVEMLQLAIPQQAVSEATSVDARVARSTLQPVPSMAQVQKLRVTPVQAQNSIVALALDH